METAISLLIVLGVLGAADTIWYHEIDQKLPQREHAEKELRLHAARDFAYALLFSSLAWVRWEGFWAWLLLMVLLAEIIITLFDFVEEDLRRKLPAGERVMHTIMAIVYGAFLANLVPEVLKWSAAPSQFSATSYGILSVVMTLMAIGVLVSGVRDLQASFFVPGKTAT